MGRNAARWTAVLLVVAVSIILILPTLGVSYSGFLAKILPNQLIDLGLDLKGGTSLTYSITEPEGIRWKDQKERDSAVTRCIEIIRNRVDAYGVAEADVHREVIDEQEAIVVNLPGIKDPEAAKNWVGQTGQLEFRMVAGKDDREGAKLISNLLDLQEQRLNQDKERINPGSNAGYGRICTQCCYSAIHRAEYLPRSIKDSGCTTRWFQPALRRYQIR
jgi:preprotein translocase subunit SecD